MHSIGILEGNFPDSPFIRLILERGLTGNYRVPSYTRVLVKDILLSVVRGSSRIMNNQIDRVNPAPNRALRMCTVVASPGQK